MSDANTPGGPPPEIPPSGPSRRSVIQAAAGVVVAGAGFAGGAWGLKSSAGTLSAENIARDRPAAEGKLTLTVNGKTHTLGDPPDQRTLLLTLREDLGLTGTKKGCNVGQCGACTVLLDDEPVYSCFVLANEAAGHKITTIEGLEANGKLHPVQQAFIDKMGSQCGMCTTGMIMSGVALLNRNPKPSLDEVKFGISGVLCRCGNYPHEVAAILAAASGGAQAVADIIPAKAGLLAPFPGAPPAPNVTLAPPANGAGTFNRLDHQGAALDGYIKATGKAMYAGDFGFHPDAPFHKPLYAKVVRCPYAHAWVNSIDDSAARKLPGYRGMITWADTPKPQVGDRGILNQHARYCGDAVAVVAADDQYTAQAAIDAVRIDWKPLQVYPDPEENLRNNNTAIQSGGPVSGYAGAQPASKPTLEYKLGDVDAGFKQADHIVEGRYVTRNQCQVPIEPHCCTAVWDGDKLTLWDSQQSIFRARHMIAEKLHITRDQLRVISHNVGGGFGGKCTDIPGKTMYQCFAALMAKKTGKPVRYEYTFEELTFAEDTRNPFIITMKTGVKKDGTITASEFRAIASAGGYTSSSPAVVGVCGEGLINAYQTANYHFTGYSVFTNSPTGGEMRGFGGPQATFCHEIHIDKVAEAIGMDPLEFRKKNSKKPGQDMTNDVVKQRPIGAARPELCMELGAKAIGWDKWQPPDKKTGRLRRGLGMSNGPQHSGRAGSDGLVWIDAQGKVHVPIGTGNYGQLSHTGIGLVAAQALDIPLEQIDVTWGDTDDVAWVYVTDASRSCNCDGKAVYNACQDLLGQLKDVAAAQLKVSADELSVGNGAIATKSGDAADFKSLLGKVPKRSSFRPYYQPDDVNPILNEGTGQVEQKPPMIVHKDTAALGRRFVEQGGVVGLGHTTWDPTTRSWGACFAEVEVDMETGQVEVLKLASVHDCGRVLYRTGAEAQVYGGAIMGMGYAMHEALEIDPNYHIPINASYNGLGVLTSLDYPELVPFLVETPCKVGPYGAKGLGENPMFGPAPAIGNAIYNAAGIRIDEIPFTRRRVYDALKRASRLVVA